MTYRDIAINGGESRNVGLTRGGDRTRIWFAAESLDATRARVGQNWEIGVDGLSARVDLVVDKDMVLVHAFGRTWRVSVIDPAQRTLLARDQSDIAKAPMPGVTISVMVRTGEAVTAGQTLVIIESMKMQMEINASRDGIVDLVHARVGESFPLGAPLVTLVALAAES